MERTITKEEALKICHKCTTYAVKSKRDLCKEGCILSDVEASHEEFIKVPDCIRRKISDSELIKIPSQTIANEGIQAQTQAATGGTKPSPNEEKSSQTNKVTLNSSMTQSDMLLSATKNGSTSRVISDETLSKTELKFIGYIQDGILSRWGLKVAHHCSLKNVDKYLTSLRKKGKISGDNHIVAGMVAQRGGTMLPSGGGGGQKQPISPQGGARYRRIHGQQFWIELSAADIRDSNGRYKPTGGDDPIWIDDERVLAHNRSIEIYSKREFIGKDKNDGTIKSLDYWHPFIARLQNRLNINIIKDGRENIHIVKQHIGYVGDPLSKSVVESGRKYHVRGYDGKLRIIIDASNGVPESEAINPGDTDSDIKRIEKQHQDWIENDPRTGTEIDNTATAAEISSEQAMHLIWEQSHLLKEQAKVMKEQAEINRDTTANVNSLSTFLKTNIEQQQKALEKPAESTNSKKEPSKWDFQIYG